MSDLSKKGCKSCPAFSKSAFARCTDEDLHALKSAKTWSTFNVDDLIVSEGPKAPSGFHCVQTGHVKVEILGPKKALPIRIAGPGDLVGFGTWLDPIGGTIAHAMEDGASCFFSLESFDLIRKSKIITDGIFQALCQIIRIKDQRISALARTSVRSRVASTLLILYKKFGVKQPLGYKLDVNLSRRDLASLAGTVPETLARTLHDFEDEDLILRQARTLYLINLTKLKEIANR